MNVGSRLNFLLIGIVLSAGLVLPGCGGGTEGTGTRPIDGTVSDISGNPISGVEVTELLTGSSDVTNAEGKFQVDTPEDQQVVEIEVKSEDFQGVVTVDASQDSTAGVSVNIKVDPKDKSLETSFVDVIAKIVGRCDVYFENNRIIRQANRTPQGIRCLARIEVRADGQTLGKVPFILQYRSCREDGQWTTLAQGTTFSGTHSGVGQLEFQYYDDPAHCVYRVLAPYEYKGATEVEHLIYTFTKQEYDRSNPEK